MEDSKNQIKIEEIINIIGIENLDIVFKQPNIVEAIKGIPTMQKFNEFYEKATNEDFYKFLLENKDDINCNKLIFLAALNIKKYLDNIAFTIEGLKDRDMPKEQKILVIGSAIEVKKRTQKIYENILKRGRNVVSILTYTTFDPDTGEIKLDLKDSRDLFSAKKINKTRNQKRFDEIDQIFKDLDPEEGTGIEYVFKKMIFTDLLAVFSIEPGEGKTDQFIGQSIISLVQDDALIRNKITTIKELKKIRSEGDIDTYFELVDKLDLDELLPNLKEEIRKNSYYLDIDKLLLVGAFRYQEELEENKPEKLIEDLKKIDENFTVEYYFESMKKVLEVMRSSIKNKKSKIEDELQFRVEKDGKADYEDYKVEYSIEDLDETIRRYIDGRYISRRDTEVIKQELLDGNMFKSQIDSRIFDLINLSNEEIETMMDHSLDNFLYGANKLKYNLEQIIKKHNGNDNIPFEAIAISLYRTGKINFDNIVDLYARKLIDAEFFKKFSEELSISSEITLKKIHQDYLNVKKLSGEVKIKKEQKLDAIVDIYKAINLEEKSEEEREDISNEIMYEIAEDFKDEDDILFYYSKGLITLEIVAEWSGEEYIEKIFAEGKISKKDLMDLFKKGKISNRLIEENFLEEEKLGEDGAYDRLINLIYSGGISESKIVDLYLEGRIFDADFDEFLNKKIISHDKYFAAKELRTLDKLEENSKIRLSPRLKNIPDKKSLLFDVAEKDEEEQEPEDWFSGGEEGSRKKKLIIDPGIRYEFLKKLGAMQADVIDIDEQNAFYNYDFFVIPNSMGEIDLDSVVIAERFYVDKETKDRFAVDNATYFFQYKDLMVNSNMSKNEMTKERDKIVFRASHRSGVWAVSVLQKLAQTMLSTKFEECTTEREKDERAEKVLDQLHRILTPKQIKDIIDLAGEIDDEEKYTYEIVDGYNSRKDSKKDIVDEFGEL